MCNDESRWPFGTAPYTKVPMVPQEKKELNRETEEPFVCLYSQKYQFKLQISFNYALNTGHFRPEALVIMYL